ncbi:hypothetical protein [Endozoicomonas sp.]|uniref:hypothetical protein n=1 Tax=Endozoicomonas sp. TaxID=1892382 RepID=UPI002886982D|nr:hypothetical protein [Endozoicomonas sp.]
MQPLLSSAPTGRLPISQPNTSARETPATDHLASPQHLNSFDQLILNHQKLILSVVEMVKCLKTCFKDNSADHFEELVNEFQMTNAQEQPDHLKKVIYALEDYFPTSKIYRPDRKERWEAGDALKAIRNLSRADKKLLIETLRLCNVDEPAPLQIKPDSYVFVLGATVPEMQKRLNYFSCEFNKLPDANNLIPERLVGVVSSRPLNPEKDRLECERTSKQFKGCLTRLSEQFPHLKNNEITEAHGFMALVDTLCTLNYEHLLSNLPITVSYTGPLSYKPQILQPNGQYMVQRERKEQSSRPNTEATIKSALTSLDLPEDADLVLVSSQPHVAAQRIAGERVAAFLGLDLRITACGSRKMLQEDDSPSIYQAIDALRKSIQLLNPNYQIISNQISAPKTLTFYSHTVDEWEIQEKVPVNALV